jgi:flagellar motor switch protein FliM
VNRELSQQEIDAVFLSSHSRKSEPRVLPFDFRRPDRIPKSQIRAIQLLHDTFVRNLISSLSVYLRSYLTINPVAVEQIAYAEFLEGLSSPTCLVSLGLRPYDGNGVLELNPALVFPVLEMLLGGTGKRTGVVDRELSEIEQKLLDGLVRIILHDLRETWRGVTEVEFTVEAMETEPQLMRVMAPNEAVVTVGVEVRIAENVGMINIALPSIVIKMMRQKFDQQWSVRKTQANDVDQGRFLNRLRDAAIALEARLEGLSISVRDLLALNEGNLIEFERAAGCPIELIANGKPHYAGQVISTGRKRGFFVDSVRQPAGQGTTSEGVAAASGGAA